MKPIADTVAIIDFTDISPHSNLLDSAFAIGPINIPAVSNADACSYLDAFFADEVDSNFKNNSSAVFEDLKVDV